MTDAQAPSSLPAPKWPTELQLCTYPDPVLKKPCKPVTTYDDELRRFCQRMVDYMYNCKGVGLAAPQVGVLYQIFVTDHLAGSEDQQEPRIWINPRIEHAGGSSTYEEGCLSIPDVYAKVERHNNFDLVYTTVDGEEKRQTLDVTGGDFLGTIVQHELDHLLGKQFIDYLSPMQLNLVRRRLKDLEKQYKKRTGKTGAALRR